MTVVSFRHDLPPPLVKSGFARVPRFGEGERAPACVVRYVCGVAVSAGASSFPLVFETQE